jgi:hypothetical protein
MRFFTACSVVYVFHGIPSREKMQHPYQLPSGLPPVQVCSKKKSRFSRDFSTYIVYNILQQSRTSLKKEVKIEPVPEIIACHFAQLSG